MAKDLQAGNPQLLELVRQKKQDFYNQNERLPNTQESKELMQQALKELGLS